MSAQSRKLARQITRLNGQCRTCRTPLRFWKIVRLTPICPRCGGTDFEVRSVRPSPSPKKGP